MRLANALALLVLSLVLVGTGASDAEARRGYYSKAGHRYWAKAYKRDVRRRAERRTRREARLASRPRPSVEIPTPVTRPVDLLAAPEPMLQAAPMVVAIEVGAAEALGAQLATTQPVPSPPGPALVNSITYDFDKGVKTVSLRDGATFVEDFDPHAFFRMMPEAGPSVTSSTKAAPAGR